MIFIPCRNGVSHRPDEYVAPEDIFRGDERVLFVSLHQSPCYPGTLGPLQSTIAG